MQVLFKVIRQTQNLLSSGSDRLEAEPATISWIASIALWEQDGSPLAKNCRTICGSCTMRINGRSVLACKENIGSEVKVATVSGGCDWFKTGVLHWHCHTPTADAIPEIIVAPMGNMPVIKDLVDIWVVSGTTWRRLSPYVSTSARQVPRVLQTPEERAAWSDWYYVWGLLFWVQCPWS